MRTVAICSAAKVMRHTLPGPASGTANCPLTTWYAVFPEPVGVTATRSIPSKTLQTPSIWYLVMRLETGEETEEDFADQCTARFRVELEADTLVR